MNTKDKLDLASMIFGIISIAAMLIGFALPFGAIGLLFALMAMDGKPVRNRLLAGLVTSIMGLIIGIAMLCSSVVLMTSGQYDQLMTEFDQYYSEEYDLFTDNNGASKESYSLIDEFLGKDSDSGAGGDSN